MKKLNLKELKIELTDICNLNCKHCSSLAKKIASKQISYEKAVSIVQEAINMKVNEIKFSGGEPLLWDGIEKLIYLLSSNKIKTSIYTTGNVNHYEEIMSTLKQAGLNRVIFSLYSTDQKIHDSITKIKGSYHKTIHAIEKSVELGFKTEIHFVPLASNYKELPQIAWLGKKIGVENISVLRLVPQGRAIKHKSEILSKDQNIELRNIIIKLREENYNIRVGSPYNFLNLPDSKMCNSGLEELTIRPDLTICPCDAFKGIEPKDLKIKDNYYSLRNNSLQDCWEKSSFLNLIRTYSTNKNYKQCNNVKNCNCGCLGQKFYAFRKFGGVHDPMCFQLNSLE